MKKRILFTDRSIVDFCTITRDTNEVHDPVFMGTLNKRVIVPGMFAFTCAVNLTSEFLKTKATKIRVYFNTLLSSGDFTDLIATPGPDDPFRIRLSAINHKDTLATQDEYTHIESTDESFVPQKEGSVLSLPVTCVQVKAFADLTGCTDPDIQGFLFSIAYASHALFERITGAETEIETEIDRLINAEGKVSPFYHMLEIFLPQPFVPMQCNGVIDFRIHFEREKKDRNYIANLQCEQDGNIIYRSVYKLVGIPDTIILRMAKNNK